MKTLGKRYIHVDNGGYGFTVQVGESHTELRNPQIVITNGRYGYLYTQLTLCEKVTPENLRAIGTMFTEAAAKLEKQK